jgi:acyl-CoA synthetase (AMP-forming)/AMP-acid ligase II
MREYFGNPAATRAVLQDSWLDTGDLGFIEDGELFVTGRAKEVVILRGVNHAPQEFEDALDGLVGVRPGCSVAVALPTEDGEELALLVERSGEVSEDAVRSRVVERTGVRPHAVHLLAPGTLPRTSSGKLRRAEALRQLLAGELRAPDRVTLLHLAKEAARSMLAKARG